MHEGEVAVGVPHIGWVSTEIHLSLAATRGSWPTARVVLSGLHGFHEDEGEPPLPPRLAPMLEEWTAILGLGPACLQRPFGTLSQGQQKLALILRALVGAPPLVIMDEVCQGLDSAHRARVLTLLDTIARTAAAGGGGWLTLVHITHHPDEALDAVTTHVLELERGKVRFVGAKPAYDADVARREQAP